MAELRYVGTSDWYRTVLNKDGKFDRTERTPPGSVVEFDDEGAEKILSAPRFMRSFVAANGPEDTYGEKYGGNRYDVQGNASAYPELDFGSTVEPRQAIFVTDEDNPEGFDVADPNRGPASDNEELLLKEEAREAGRKAEYEARQKLMGKRSQRSSPTKSGERGSGGGTPERREGTAEGAQKSNDGNTGA